MRPAADLSARSSVSDPDGHGGQRLGRGGAEPIKVTLLGSSSSGKSALRRRFVHGDFLPRYRATIGCDFLVREVNLGADVVELQVWDTAGQERFKSISTPFFRASRACVLTFDYTRPVAETVAHLAEWYREFRAGSDCVQRGERFCWAVVGCKLDLVKSRVERDAIDAQVRDHVSAWFDRDEGPNSGSSGRVRAVEEGRDSERRAAGGARRPTTTVRVGPGPAAIPSSASHRSHPTPRHGDGGDDDDRDSDRTPRVHRRPSLIGRPASTESASSSTTTTATVELASSVPTVQALNPNSVLLMATSPPRAPSSVEPLGHPDAVVYEGGPFSADAGRILEDEDESAMFRMFRTSAKTGEGVDRVFEYCARKALANLAYNSSAADETGPSSRAAGVIKINEREQLTTGQKLKRACCT
ncbi:hypothetical protein JCM11491_000258 [Sporobolomyces phaffii]